MATGLIQVNPVRKALQDIEVLDLKNPDMKCQNLAPFPDGLIGATGAFVNNSIAVVCGGAKGTVFGRWNDVYDHATDDCYSITKNSTTFHQSLDTKRSQATSIAVNNTLWILGGVKFSGYLLSSTEYLDSGIDMSIPLPLRQFAIVELETGDYPYILIGGRTYTDDGRHINKSFLLQQNKSWTPGPNLNEARSFHTAGVITDKITLKKMLVVVGGISDIGGLSSVEMMPLPIVAQANTTWQKGMCIKMFSKD